MSRQVLSGLLALAVGGLWTVGCDKEGEGTSIGGVASAGSASAGSDGGDEAPADDEDEDHDEDDDGLDDADDDQGGSAGDDADEDTGGADDHATSGGLPGMDGSDTGGDESGGVDLPDEPSDCCTPSSMPGCTMPSVQECVCAQDEFCCSDAWDFVCIMEVNDYACGIMCEVPDPGGDLPDEPSDCCTATAQPGCTDMAIETCVCEQDEFCCMTNWDALCVEEVASFMCGECPA